MSSLPRREVRKLDRYAIDVLGVPGLVLMENAGRRSADVAEAMLGSAAGKNVAVVAGGGNNAGDGFVLARHLEMRGANVVTYLVRPGQTIKGDAAVNLQILRGLDHDIRPCAGEELEHLSRQLAQADLVVDAIGGTGITGALRGDLAAAVEQINDSGRPVLAIDIPTGLDCDAGRAEGPVVRATRTVTMLVRKSGFDNPDAARYTGDVVVADIGIPPQKVAELAGRRETSE